MDYGWTTEIEKIYEKLIACSFPIIDARFHLFSVRGQEKYPRGCGVRRDDRIGTKKGGRFAE